MSPDEARMMRLFATSNLFPLIDVRLYAKEAQGYQIIYRSFSNIGKEAGCSSPDLTPNYLDNLTRLGLVESPGAHGPLSPTMTAPNTYEPLETADQWEQLKKQMGANGARLEFGRTYVTLTDLGKQFCRACVIEKSAAATPEMTEKS